MQLTCHIPFKDETIQKTHISKIFHPGCFYLNQFLLGLVTSLFNQPAPSPEKKTHPSPGDGNQVSTHLLGDGDGWPELQASVQAHVGLYLTHHSATYIQDNMQNYMWTKTLKHEIVW